MPVQRPLSTHGSLGRIPGSKLLPDLVHLLAHNADDFVQRPLPEKKVVVNARAKLPHIPGPEKEFVAGHFGIRRGLAQSRNEEL
jgi:hypothetical protein